jgi:glutamate-ammonia-ligase adenylyltransferase
MAIEWERWREAALDPAHAESREAMLAAAETPSARLWLNAIFGNSPYLTRLALREPAIVSCVLDQGPDASLDEVLDGLNREDARQSRPALAARLRIVKRQAALIIGMADIGGIWPLARVTATLSALAAAALSLALRHLLLHAAEARQIRLADPGEAERGCGIILLGMGKLGAWELNYSSDIDLIILFDAERIDYVGRAGVESFMAGIARDLVKLMEERTGEGYVFRMDLRLRPDPRSTPPAISVAAAEGYYGSLGQNWERAAMIKARPVAGDFAVGQRFLASLTPYIWRKHLDFAAIRDIHAIKRQIDARHAGSPESLAGHNIKLGHGGIREIEFFAQTQQLIWGGRLPQLRVSGTVEALVALARAARIERETADELSRAYRFLRQIEHRLQMVEDSQTHSLPKDQVAFDRFSIFAGFADRDAFTKALRAELDTVRRHFRDLFREAPPLSDEGNLVFTGKEADEDTLTTIARLGFKEPAKVIEAIQGWHHGRIRATRSERARELLTELVPEALRAIGATAAPDLAFQRFDEFMGHLPAGVQLFSLFRHRPQLLTLVAEIMGEAPLLAAQLAKKPLLLDAVLSGDFFALLPPEDAAAATLLRGDLDFALSRARDYEDTLNLTRRWTADRRFQTGVQLLQGRIDGFGAGRDFTLIAETVIATLLPAVEAEFARHHGTVAGGQFAVLALGKLGSREMNSLSDLDLIFVYRADPAVEASDGARPLAPAGWFARLAQRLINALAAPMPEGTLYDVDMRLRPSGNAGPIASSFEGFERYYREQAWTWELMALTRARVVAGDAALGAEVERLIEAVLTRPRDPRKLLVDVAEMRERMIKAHPAPKAWDCKHRRGAIVDVEFVAQYLALSAAPEDASVLARNPAAGLRRLGAAGRLDAGDGWNCLEALGLWHRIQQMMRVALGKVEGEAVAPELLDRVLTRATRVTDSAAARWALIDTISAEAQSVYRRMIAEPAALARMELAHAAPPQPEEETIRT